MTKIVKRIFLVSTVLFSLLLISCIYSSLVLPVYATEPNIQDKTMAILNDVIGLNTEEYATSLNSQLDNQYLSLPQKEADITLASAEGKLRVSSSFVNNNLRQIYLSDFEGKLSVEQPAADTVEMAKGLLERYRNYVGDSFYGELASMLDNVDVTKNTTKSAGNIKLKVLNLNQTIVDYVWTYTDENGIVAKSKNVILSYDRGQLKVFLNNWPLYTVVGTPEISGEEATAIALDASKTFSYKVSTDNGTLTVTGFEIAPESLGHETLSYLNFPNQSLARGGDPFTLYPSWYVPLGFNQSYPGAVTGMTVSIWADAGEISTMGPMVVGFPSATFADEEAITDGFNRDSTMLSVPIVITAIFSVFGVSLVSRKKIAKLAGSRKLFSRFGGTLLCGIILFSVILVATPTVAASPTIPLSKARIYAAFNSVPPQLPEEVAAAIWVCGQIDAAFEASGYYASNLAGDYTTKGNVTYNAEYDEQIYDRVAMFHFGHLAEFNTAYQDNNHEHITSNDIYPLTSLQKHVFVFIWVCTQAQNPTSGMPEAWTHRDGEPDRPYMSEDGYLSPDCKGQCYIGFYGISPIISGFHQTFEEQMTDPVKYFIKYFYDYALRNSYSVRDALNRATLDFFGYTYTSSILYGEDGEGYHAWWPGGGGKDEGYYPGYMRVFGDGSMWVFQPKITLTSSPALSPTFYLDGEPFSTGDIHVWPAKLYTISVSDVTGYDFDYFSYNGQYLGRPASIQLNEDGALTAHYSLQTTYYSLSISSSSGGYTSPSPGTYWYVAGFPAQVTAYPYGDYNFDYWLLDGGYYSSNPTVMVTMNSNHNLQAIFCEPPPVYHYLTLEYWGWIGGWVYMSGGTSYLPEGTYTLTVPWTYGGLYFVCWYYDGAYRDYYDNSITISLTSDRYFAALYSY